MKRIPKGIESLIPHKKSNKGSDIKKDAVFYVDVRKIFPNPYQPRKEFLKESLDDLVSSIKEYGIIQPLVVTRVEKGRDFYYQLVAGERRFIAAKEAGLKIVPVLIKDIDDRKKLEIALIENVQREDLNALEKAEALKKLYDEFNVNQEEIANIVGKSRVYVANLLRILRLPDQVKNLIRLGKISEGHAKALLSLKKKEEIIKFAKKAAENNISVRELEAMIRKHSVWKHYLKKVDKDTIKRIKSDIKEIFKDKNGKDIKVGEESGRIKVIFYFDRHDDVPNFFKRNG